ncbi:MAG: Uma2 family endonuclease [Cyanobacteria bacterium J06648_16]
MPVALESSSSHTLTANGDVLTIQTGRTWTQFKHLQKGFENTHGIRLFYHNGTVEILMPGKPHELFKSVIGMLIEVFLLDREIEFEPTGSMTQEAEGIASAEADESYKIDGYRLSVEVNFTSGSKAKLDRYRALGVDEVWLWEDAVLRVYHLHPGGYERVEHSLIPALATVNLAAMAACILTGETSRVSAVKQFRAAHPVAVQ